MYVYVCILPFVYIYVYTYVMLGLPQLPLLQRSLRHPARLGGAV